MPHLCLSLWWLVGPLALLYAGMAFLMSYAGVFKRAPWWKVAGVFLVWPLVAFAEWAYELWREVRHG